MLLRFYSSLSVAHPFTAIVIVWVDTPFAHIEATFGGLIVGLALGRYRWYTARDACLLSC